MVKTAGEEPRRVSAPFTPTTLIVPAESVATSLVAAESPG
jgi:hypothetical protein